MKYTGGGFIISTNSDKQEQTNTSLLSREEVDEKTNYESLQVRQVTTGSHLTFQKQGYYASSIDSYIWINDKSTTQPRAAEFNDEHKENEWIYELGDELIYQGSAGGGYG